MKRIFIMMFALMFTSSAFAGSMANSARNVATDNPRKCKTSQMVLYSSQKIYVGWQNGAAIYAWRDVCSKRWPAPGTAWNSNTNDGYWNSTWTYDCTNSAESWWWPVTKSQSTFYCY